jgi:CDP-diacylglycerol/glycerol-3-phosphate3-phosphatidyl transferase
MVGLVGLLTPWSFLFLPAGVAGLLVKAAYAVVAAALVVTVVTGLDYVREAVRLSRRSVRAGR